MTAFETQEWENYESLDASGEQESQWNETGEFESDENELLGELLGDEYETDNEQEMQETELASELLEISSEEELEQFLGKLIRGAAKAVGGVVKSPIGRALGGALKGVARAALPVAAGALGNFVLPGVGGVVGSKLGSMASKLFEVELESMDEQEAEFEVARRYVRFASAAARSAAKAPAGAPPKSVARAAVISAARKHAPGLVRSMRPTAASGPSGRRPRPQPGSYGFASTGGRHSSGGLGCNGAPWESQGVANGTGGTGGRTQSGRWVRRGRKIVILGV